MDIFPPIKQRPALLEMLKVLDASPLQLRRDECGDWRIKGKHGHIYAIPSYGPEKLPKTWKPADGLPCFEIWFSLVYVPDSASVRRWGFVKEDFAGFAKITQDGDSEGAFTLDHLPTSDEGEAIRRRLGVKKRRNYTHLPNAKRAPQEALEAA